MTDRKRMRVLVTEWSHPIAFRYWRRRYGWEAGQKFLHLALPLTIPDEQWKEVESLIGHFSKSLAIKGVPRSELTFSLFLLGKVGHVPASNVASFAEELSNFMPRLLPYHEEVSELILDKDRISLRAPIDSAFMNQIGEFHDRVSGMTGDASRFDPFYVSVDIAYCEADDVWTGALESLDSRLGAIDITAESAQLRAISMSHDRYEIEVLQTFLPAPDSGEYNDVKSSDKAPSTPVVAGASTSLVWHINDSFHFHLDDPSGTNHALLDFVKQISSDLQAEYNRIQQRVNEDPGTAGDEGESNWKEILDRWLPATVHIVTKGRILSKDGKASPQIDVIVLHPTYPEGLRHKKLYFADGVMAAFECKLTLRQRHFPSIFRSARRISELASLRNGDAVSQAASKIIFGVLAHSSEWQAGHHERVIDELSNGIKNDTHPREAIDVLCIADAGAWTYEVSKNEFLEDSDARHAKLYRVPKGGAIHSQYLGWTVGSDSELPYSPIYVLIKKLWERLAMEDPTLESFARYLRMVHIPFAEGKMGVARSWPMDIVKSDAPAERGE